MNFNDYPEIKVKEINIKYARLLLEDYAGAVSELSAVTQYFYHSSVISTKYPEVSKILSSIAIMETIHLQILGKLIYLLGVNPKYRVINNDNKRVWWYPGYVDYQSNILEVIKADIKSEQVAIDRYTKHLEEIKDDYIIAILVKIIMDEREHLKILTQLYENLKSGKKINLNTEIINELEKQRPSNDDEIKPPNRYFTLEELQKDYNGENGKPSYVVIDGIVYNVSNIDVWAGGTHFGLYAGENHTEDYIKHHDGAISMIKQKVPMVGYLKNE